MIRRGFWLAVGAALGVTGYRKAAKLARTLTGQQPTSFWAQRQGRHGQVAANGWAQLGSREPAALAAGSPPQAGSPAAAGTASPAGTDPAVAGAGRPAATPWPVRLIAGARATASFVRDVREGMADYRELHGEQLGRSLGGQAGQIAPGRSPRGPREP